MRAKYRRSRYGRGKNRCRMPRSLPWCSSLRGQRSGGGGGAFSFYVQGERFNLRWENSDGKFIVQCGDKIPTIAFGRFFSQVHILTKPQCGSWLTTTSLTKRESGSKIVDRGSVVRDGPDKLSPQCKGGVGSCLGSLGDRSCNPPKLSGEKKSGVL